MLNAFIFILLLLFFLFLNKVISKKNNITMDFLSLSHTNILRGIAAIMVVISHTSGIYGTKIFTPLGGIGVSIFVICSAYGLSKSYEKKGLDKFFKKRIFKILIPYWVTTIFYNIINYNEFEIAKFIKEILLINEIPYMWFVQLILILYIIFYIIYRFVPQNKRILVYFLLSLCSLFLIKNDLWAEQSFAFIVGIILANYKQFMFNTRKTLILGLACLAIGAISLCIKQLPQVRSSVYIIMNINQMILKTVTAIGIIYLTYSLLNILFSIFTLVGKLSYEVYLVHTLFIYIIKNNSNIITMILYLLICNIAILILKAITDKIFKLTAIDFKYLKSNTQ